MNLSLFQQKVTAFVLLIACINLFMGCHRYFRPVEINTPSIETKQTTLKKLSTEDKYFILRRGSNSYALSNLVLDAANMTLSADIAVVPPVHQMYVQRYRNPNFHYSKAKHQDVVLKEVHLYTGETQKLDSSLTNYTLSLADVQKIEVIDFDKKRTSNSYALGTIGIVLGVALVVVIIAAIAYKPDPTPPPPSGSCPYISTFNGTDYQLQGEIYTGSVYKALEKDDYLPLKLEPVQGNYRLKISNELQEIQHTDLADLVVVEHNSNVKISVDPNGKFYSTALPELPVSATLNNHTDVSEQLMNKDNNSCIFKDDNISKPLQDIFVTFKNDSKSTNGKLILSAKSSSWMNYLYGEFSKGFGSYYNKWDEEQEKKPASESEQWMKDQYIPLTVSVKTATGWKEIQQIRPIGPLFHRDVVIPVELPGEGPVEFKISTGYMFWELDYAAIDYSSNADFSVKTIKPYEATNEKGANVLPDLVNADKKYLVQPNVGDAATLVYKSIDCKEGMAQSFFLHSSGYYKRIRHFDGKPKVGFLKSFKQPGALSAFSRQKFMESWNNIATTKK